MLAVVGQLLPLMLAGALSTVPILVTITILLAPRPTTSAILFLIGWMIGLFLVTALFAFGVQSVTGVSLRRNQQAVGIAEILIGSALITSGIVLAIRRPRRRDTVEGTPRWLRTVGRIKPVASLGFGLLLNIRPKALLIAAAAGLIIGTSRLDPAETMIVLAVFTVVSGSTVATPVVLAIARPVAMRRRLERAQQWIVRNSRAVTIVVLLVVGTFVLGDGLTRL
ncbi:MAG: GAP family protein [Mycetocola sp.]